MVLQCGIVGLPNAGKSTLFNAITETSAAAVSNYPFCTIEPNIGTIAVPDERLSKLANIACSTNVIPARIEFVDIAGLVRGANEGEGLGNKFLGHIREVDVVACVVRCFEDAEITHVEGRVSPIDDAAIIKTELILADLKSLEKRVPILEKKMKGGGEGSIEARKSLAVVLNAMEVLNSGKFVSTIIEPANAISIKNLQLLTSKPLFYVCNIAEADIAALAEGHAEGKILDVLQMASNEGAEVVCIAVKFEAEIATLTDEEDKKEFLTDLGVKVRGLDKVVQCAYRLLNLITFFTVGPLETHAWPIMRGTVASIAAGTIHTDFEIGFIRAEVINYNDYIVCEGEQKAKEVGKMRLEGRDYVVNDGDIMHIRFNKTGGRS